MSDHIVKSAFQKDKNFLKSDEIFMKKLALDFYQMKEVKFTIEKNVVTDSLHLKILVYVVESNEYFEEKQATLVAETVNVHSLKLLINPTAKPVNITTNVRTLSIGEIINLLIQLNSPFENTIDYLQNIRGSLLANKMGII